MTPHTMFVVGILCATPIVAVLLVIVLTNVDLWVAKQSWARSEPKPDPFEDWPVLDHEPAEREAA